MTRASSDEVGTVRWDGAGYKRGRVVELRGRLAQVLAGDPPEWISRAAWVGLGRAGLALLNAGYPPDTSVIIEATEGSNTGGPVIWLRVADDSTPLDRERARRELVPVAADAADRREVTA